jgi:hypothetical protein
MRLSDPVNTKTPMQERYQQRLRRGLREWLRPGALALAILTAAGTAGQGQAKPPVKRAPNQAASNSPAMTQKASAGKPGSEPDLAWLQEAMKNPDLMNEISHLSQRLAQELHYPAPRTQSRFLPRLPQSTFFYGAIPNFGPALHQAVQIFHEELQTSAVLRDFLQKNKIADQEARFEEGAQKLYDFSEYLGDEFLVVANMSGKEPRFALLAEVRKPGLRSFLENLDQQWSGGKAGEHIRIFDPQQLASASDVSEKETAVLVRPDLVAVGFGTAALRDLNSQMDQGGGAFAASPLGKRLSRAYKSGTSTLFGVDLQKVLAMIPPGSPQARMILDKTGFADAAYGVMEGKLEDKQSENNMELVFNAPRHGVASWIGPPAELGSLDFMSPKSALAEAVRLKNPVQILDDLTELAGPGAFALRNMEAQFGVNLERDVLSKLTGEIGGEFQLPPIALRVSPSGKAGPEGPGNFKVLLGVSDPAGLQRTITRLLAQAPLQSAERQENGVTFHTLAIPGAAGMAREFTYFFMDGYMVITSTRAAAEEAVRLHRAGISLARSDVFSGKPGKTPVASGVVVQNAGGFLAAMLSQAPTELSSMVTQALAQAEPKANVFYGYADETSLRATTNNAVGTDAGLAIVVATLAIPNLMRARMSANEAGAAATVRTVNTAEITYSVTYPKRGYAPTLAALGPGRGGDCSDSNVTPSHACLLDSAAGNADCTAGKWCEKGGYRYSIRGVCLQTNCRAYVVTATPTK